MKNPISLFLLLCLPLFCIAQSALPRIYDYDAAGNRTLRRIIPLKAPEIDTLTNTETQNFNNQNYYLETIFQIEIKIYPNPTTEKITMQISNLENLTAGCFKLYSLNGQLLQEQTVTSEHTTISLAGFAKGAYFLKVQINDRIEEWKIIKQ